LSRCKSQFFCCQSSARSLRTFSCYRRRTSQLYMELTVWTVRTNSLWIFPLMSKKMMSMLLILLFTCLAVFGLPVPSMPIKHPCTVHAFFTERFSNHCQGRKSHKRSVLLSSQELSSYWSMFLAICCCWKHFDSTLYSRRVYVIDATAYSAKIGSTAQLIVNKRHAPSYVMAAADVTPIAHC
jgi:hypothetical protein